MAKQIAFNNAARSKMLRGIDKLARAVEITLGVSGPGAVIQHRTDGFPPIYTRDGFTVAHAITLNDPVEDLGARILRDVAGAVSRRAGDGTTTSVVLARKIAQGCARSLAAGAHPTALRQGIETAAAHVSAALRERAVRTLDRDLYRKVCHSAGKDDEATVDRILDAMAAVGAHGTVTIAPGRSLDDGLKITDGARWDQGYLSAYFNTDRERSLAELENPYILLYDREVTDFMDLVPLLEAVQERSRSLLIVAENIAEKALAPLLLNHVRGHFRAVAVKPPGYGDRRLDRLDDLAVLTGGRACLDIYGAKLTAMTLDDLGQADLAVVDAESTTLIGGRGAQSAIEARIRELAAEAARIGELKPGHGSTTGNRQLCEELEERAQILRGRTAAYEVGGVTDLAIRERVGRVENAYKAICAAREEGVLPGGGIGLLATRSALDELCFDDPDKQRGVDIVRAALAEPLRRIAANAGMNAEAIVAAVLAVDDGGYGFDAGRRCFGDLWELGIVDPVKVTRLALENAAGIAGTVIATEAVVYRQPTTERLPDAEAVAEWAAATREDPRS